MIFVCRLEVVCVRVRVCVCVRVRVRVHALLAATGSWVLSQLSYSVGRLDKVLWCEATASAPFVIPSQVFQQCPRGFLSSII